MTTTPIPNPRWKPPRHLPRMIRNPKQIPRAIPHEILHVQRPTAADVEFDTRRGVCTNLIAEEDWVRRLYLIDNGGTGMGHGHEHGNGKEMCERREKRSLENEDTLPYESTTYMPHLTETNPVKALSKLDQKRAPPHGHTERWDRPAPTAPRRSSFSYQPATTPRAIHSIKHANTPNHLAARDTRELESAYTPASGSFPQSDLQSTQALDGSTTPTNSPPPLPKQRLPPFPAAQSNPPKRIIAYQPRSQALSRPQLPPPHRTSLNVPPPNDDSANNTHINTSSVPLPTQNIPPSTSTVYPRTTTRSRLSTSLGLSTAPEDATEEGEDAIPVGKGRNRGDATPYGNRGNTTPYGNRGNTTPYGNRGNTTPYVNRGNATPYINRGNTTPYVNRGNSTPYINRGNTTPYLRRNSPPPPPQTVHLAVQPKSSGGTTPLPIRKTTPPPRPATPQRVINSRPVSQGAREVNVVSNEGIFEGMEFHLPEQYLAVLKPLRQQITDRGGRIVPFHRARYIILPIPKGQLATSGKEVNIIREAEEGVGQSAISWDWVRDSVRDGEVDLRGYKVKIGVVPKRKESIDRGHQEGGMGNDQVMRSSPLFSEVELPAVLPKSGSKDLGKGKKKDEEDDEDSGVEESGRLDSDSEGDEPLTPLEGGESTDGEQMARIRKQVSKVDERLDEVDSDYSTSQDKRQYRRRRLGNTTSEVDASRSRKKARLGRTVEKGDVRAVVNGARDVMDGKSGGDGERGGEGKGREELKGKKLDAGGHYQYSSVDEVDKEDVDWFIKQYIMRTGLPRGDGKPGFRTWLWNLTNSRIPVRKVRWGSLYIRYKPFIKRQADLCGPGLGSGSGPGGTFDDRPKSTALSGTRMGKRERKRGDKADENGEDESDSESDGDDEAKQGNKRSDLDDLKCMRKRLDERDSTDMSLGEYLKELDQERTPKRGGSWSRFYKLYRNVDLVAEGSGRRVETKHVRDVKRSAGPAGRRRSQRVMLERDGLRMRSERDGVEKRDLRAARRGVRYVETKYSSSEEDYDQEEDEGQEEGQEQAEEEEEEVEKEDSAKQKEKADLEWLQTKIYNRPRGMKTKNYLQTLRLERTPRSGVRWTTFYNKHRDELSLDRMENGVIVPFQQGFADRAVHAEIRRSKAASASGVGVRRDEELGMQVREEDNADMRQKRKRAD